MIYNKKNFVKTDGRVLTSSGPRSSQERLNRLKEEGFITELLAQIDTLKNKISNSEQIVSTEQDKLNERIKYLEDQLQAKDELIAAYKKIIADKDGGKPQSEDRPSVDLPVVDPTVSISLEDHIADKVTSITNEKMTDQVSKLRKLLKKD